MRYFWIGVSLFIACMICLGVVLDTIFDQADKINAQRQQINNLKGALLRGNVTIKMADSVIKANTIYVGPQIHDTIRDTIVVVKPDTILYFRWLNNKKFKHAK